MTKISKAAVQSAHRVVKDHPHFRVYQAADYLGPNGHIAGLTHLDAESKRALVTLLDQAKAHVEGLPEAAPQADPAEPEADA